MKARRKWAGLLLMFILVMCLGAAKPAISPPAAQAGIIPSPCDLIPDGAARKACQAATNPVGTAVGAIPGIPDPSDVVGDVAEVIVQPILNQIAKAEADAVVSVLEDVSKFVNNSTTPALTASWFLHLYAIVFGLAIPIGVVLLYTRLGIAVRDTEPGAAAGAFFRFMALLVLGGLIPGVVGLVVVAMDTGLAPAWMSSAGADANKSLHDLSLNMDKSVSFSNNPVTPILLPLIFLFAGVIGGILMELMMLFREAMLYVVTATEIVAAALAVSGNSDMLRRTTQKLGVLCLFKVIVAFILTIGLLMLGSSGVPYILGAVVLVGTPVISWAAYQNWGNHPIRFLPGGWMYTQNMLRRLRQAG